jgi:cytochrome P450
MEKLLPVRHNFPLFGDDFKRNPYPTYTRLIEEAPVHPVVFPSGVCGWLVTGYGAAVQFLSDRRVGKRHELGNSDWRARASIMPEPQHAQLQAHLLHQDPPEHTALRGMIATAFTPTSSERLVPVIEAIVDRLLDTICLLGQADLVASFTACLPLEVLGEAIGLAPSHRAQFQRQWCKAVQPVGPDEPGRAAYISLLCELKQYVDRVIIETRGGDESRLLVRLIEEHDRGNIRYDVLTSTIFQLLVAGQEPVSNQLALMLVTLLRHPEHMAHLRAQPELVSQAVEELMRFDGAFELTTWRFFSKPTAVHDVVIPAGDPVIVALNAANRDPARFACPHRLDFERKNATHLSFGYGRHFCPAASLTRLQLELSLKRVLERLPELRLACEEHELRWIPAVLARGVQALPVTFRAGPRVGSIWAKSSFN